MSNVLDFMIPVKLKSETVTGVLSQDTYTLTTISIPNSDSDRCLITIQGRKQDSSAFTINSPTSITFSEDMEGGELIEVTIPSFK